MMIPDKYPYVTVEKRIEHHGSDPQVVIVRHHNTRQSSTLRVPYEDLDRLAAELIGASRSLKK